MEPTATPPWRVLDAPAPGKGPVTNGPPPDPGTGALLAPTALKVLATGGAAVACAVLAFILAFGDSPDGGLIVEGGAALPVPGASAAPGPASGSAATGDASQMLVVEIVGAVPRPGVFRLPAGSRVGDLVAAAGGYGARVDTARAERELKLAAVLQDGDQVRVPSRDDALAVASGGEPGAAGDDGVGAGAPIDLNRATQSELEELPGVGPATALKIIAAREEAPFAAVEELRSRGVLGEKTFEKVRELVAVR